MTNVGASFYEKDAVILVHVSAREKQMQYATE